MMNTPGPIEVVAFEAAHSRAYLAAVFKAWGSGQTVMALPEGAGRKTIPGTKVLSRESFAPDPGWFDARLPERPEDDPALIAFSSGTTGRPKAILIAHGALQNVVSRINTAMAVDDTIREYLGVPVTYSFGLGRVRAVAAAGGKSYLPEHGFDPSEIGRMLATGEINAVSAVPTLWRVLLANKGSISEDSAQNLRWIEIGSQWMTGAEKLELRQLFPNAKIVQHYGLTEASRTTLLDISAAPEDRLDSVGQAVGNIEISIDEDGRIRTRGPHLAMGLVSGAGVKPVADADGWMTTSDRGQVDDGWLSYEGRVDELINAGGLKIDPTAFEQAVNTVLGVPGAVAAGRLADDLRGEKVLIALRQDAGLDRDAVTSAIRAEATRIGLTGNGSFELREVAELPLTATGKVKRADLAALPDIGSTPASAAPEAPKTGSKSEELQTLWAEILGLDSVPTDKSFYDLGGDSLSALTTIMRMESLGIDAEVARGIFEGKTIAEMGVASEPEPAHTGASNGKAAELQVLWSEILGLNDVPTDKSFYDLGGDSLSALTAIMRMESLGIDAEVARGIFEGKTIAEMGGTETSPAPPVAEQAPSKPAVITNMPTSGKTHELQALWAEILGLDSVPTDKSFYDLGGDSLSALTTIMRMESLGIDAEVARGIFEGRTIAGLAGDSPAPTPRPADPPDPVAAKPAPVAGLSLTLAETVNSIHATRGVLVLWVVIVHWLPALLKRIDPDLLWYYEAATPAWRMGTPGFAMVFGMGIGALGLHHYMSNRALFLKSTRFNTKLIVTGVLILAFAKLCVAAAEGNLGNRFVMSGLFYSAISFYALAMLTLPLIVWTLSRGENRLLTILAAGSAAAVTHLLLHGAFAHLQPIAPLETIKILLTAKYGYFRMASFVMIGVAIGWLFRRYHDDPLITQNLGLYGLVLITFGGVGTYQAEQPLQEFGRTYLWNLSVYAGIVTLVLAGFARLNRAGGPKQAFSERFNAFFVASGILALPIFVGHEIIFAVKQLFDAFSVSDWISLTILLGVFLGGMFMAYRKLWRILVR